MQNTAHYDPNSALIFVGYGFVTLALAQSLIEPAFSLTIRVVVKQRAVGRDGKTRDS